MSAERVVALDVGDVLAITDWFIIASAPNVRRVRAHRRADGRAREGGRGRGALYAPKDWTTRSGSCSTSGSSSRTCFHEPTREYYDLERLWSDVPRHEFG